MASLNWDKFYSLAGSCSQNFEDLCRALIRLNFGRYGNFVALKNQPGVEFHLKLSETCSALGALPCWYGWQCKVHTLTKSKDLTSSSRKDIKDSLEKTRKYLPLLTDWVLWTPYILSKKDQDWFYALKSKFKLHLWDDKDINAYLNGPALMLREAYFGDLILTNDALEQLHQESVQPILKRWLGPALHQQVGAERAIQRMLGEPDSWEQLMVVGKRLREAEKRITKGAKTSNVEEITTPFVFKCNIFSDMLMHFHSLLADGCLDIIQQELFEQKTLINKEMLVVPRLLRTRNLSIALDATNALDDIRIGQEMLDEVEEYLSVGLVAVLADAGGGKTHMAVNLTASQKDRPAGILFFGKNLHRGQTLNDLAQSISINGSLLTSIEKLLVALDVVGKRSKCRLPLVIDGLNEAENPMDWKDSLASFAEMVKRYPNVLVVCTLRTGEHRRDKYVGRRIQPGSDSRESFAVMALPENVRKIESEGFGVDVYDAIRKYFSYFKINPGDSEIPVELLRHPLTLRIFCEVINPRRESEIRVDYFPASLSPLFEKYVANSCERISLITNLSYSYSIADIELAFYMLGLELWKAGQREISEDDYKASLSGTAFAWDRWDSNIVNLLAQEGFIFRNPGTEPGQYVITPVYDAFGGYIIADSLIKKNADNKFFEWLKTPDTIEMFSGDNSHQLAVDIFKSLVTLTPRRMYDKQLWKEAPDIFKHAALMFTTELDAGYLDKDTIAALLVLVKDNSDARIKMFARLKRIRGANNHPLNSEFLDFVLRSMVVSERDLSWTEWIRKSRKERINDILKIEDEWKKDLTTRTPSDRLQAKWAMWLLTSTDRELRDIATRALYWFGRGDPETLFKESLNSFDINDPYVPERMLAASYGVVMAKHVDPRDRTFAITTLSKYAKDIYNAMFEKSAPFSTTHFLMRDYAARIIEIALLYSTEIFSSEERERIKSPFKDRPIREWKESESAKEKRYGFDSPFGMDFENYTLGRLVRERSNYDYEHEEYKKVRAQVFWRVEQLGWVSNLFESVDSSIAGEHRWPRTEGNFKKTERYGKKYSWIAFYEMAGYRSDLGLLNDWDNEEIFRISDVDIDPSFPGDVREANIIKGKFVNRSMSIKKWINSGPTPNLKPYLAKNKLCNFNGPWVLLDGYVNQESIKTKRDIFVFIRGFFVDKSQVKSLIRGLNSLDYPGNNRLPEIADDYYTFAGEIPWCDTFPHYKDQAIIEIPTGKKIIVKQKIDKSPNSIVIDLGNKKITIPSYSPKALKKGFSEREVDERISFDVSVPVRNFSWESGRSITNSGHNSYIPSKEICQSLKLVSYPQVFDMYDSKGKIASLTCRFGDLWHFGHKVIYLRKDLLDTYLKETKMSLVWIIWGERRFRSTDDGDYKKFSKKSSLYKVYKKVETYSNNDIVGK